MSSKKESDAKKRLVLGFDAGCCTCSEIARRVEECIGDRLEIISLRDPRVQEWRERTLGGDAPWVPTLFEIRGSKVRAWTGWRLGAQLSCFLGPVATWRIMQALGEIGGVKGIEEPPAAKVAGGPTRGQFLKGVGGAAVAMTILSGTGKLARPAQAATITRTRELTGSELINVARKGATRKDSINVLDKVWSDGMQTGAVTHMRNGNGDDLWFICHDPAAGCSPRWDADGNLFIDDGTTAIKAAKHTLSNGNTMTTVSYGLSNGRVMAFRSYTDPQRLGGRAGKVKTMALRYRITDNGNSFPLREQSVNGKLVQLPTSGTVSIAQACDECTEFAGTFTGDVCLEPRPVCLIGGCGACFVASCNPAVFSTIAGATVCYLCAAAICPDLLIYGCCNEAGTACFTCNRSST